MDDLLGIAGLAGGLAVASGFRLYATVATIGFASRQGWVDLPPGLESLGHNWIIVLAALFALAEFVADKVPAFDSVWDAVHTFIRVPAGVLLGWGAFGAAPEPWRTGAALLCGTLSLSSHGLKAGTRLAVNASPEPFSNWSLSFLEELFVGALLWFAIKHPIAALVSAALVVLASLVVVTWLFRVFVRLVGKLRKAPATG
jgi:uncharacterized membrane protein